MINIQFFTKIEYYLNLFKLIIINEIENIYEDKPITL